MKTSKENEFLTGLQREGQLDQTGTEEEEKETPAESSTETKPEESATESQTGAESEEESGDESSKEKGKEGEAEPAAFQAFHTHPRWRALMSELDELRQFRDKFAPLLGQLEQSNKAEETEEIPGWFSELFGSDDAAWGKFRAYNQQQRTTLIDEIMSKIREDSQRVVQEEKKYDKWVSDELTNLEAYVAENKLPAFDRNELLKIAIKYSPSDEEGNVSLKKAYELLQNLKASGQQPKPKTSDEKKKIADTTMQKGTPSNDKKDYKTPNDLRGKSFRDLANLGD